MQINEAYAKADQKEMSIHVASLRACPAAKVPAPQVKDKSTTIGRDHKQDVAVDDDKKVSREHARIDCTGDGKVIFMDLGSSHGSKVNGKSVAGRVSLAVGDVIKVGKTKILFTIIPAGAEDPIR